MCLCAAAMQWEIAATSAVVWNVHRCDVCADACAWPTNETTTEPGERCSLPSSGSGVGFTAVIRT